MAETWYLQSSTGERLTVAEGNSSVGRTAGNTLVVTHTMVSGRHALITRHNDAVWIEDIGSSNGTFVNDVRLVPRQKQQLYSGDVVKFSLDVVYKLYYDTADLNTIQATSVQPVQPSMPVQDYHQAVDEGRMVNGLHRKNIDYQQPALLYSESTRLLCAAAHLDSTVHDQFKTHDENRYKASTPEYFIDVERIRTEAQKAFKRDRVRRFIHLAIMVFVLLLWLTNDIEDIFIPSLFMAWFSLWSVDVIFHYRRKRYVQEHFVTQHTHNDYQVGPESQNLIVYSGFAPFVGSGVELATLSFAIDLTKPAESDQKPEQVTVSELFSEVSAALNDLAIPDLYQKDLLFVNGKDLRNQKQLGVDAFEKPKTNVKPHVIQRYIGKRDSAVRSYRLIQIPIWHGQLILSIYLRLIDEVKNLFVEVNYHLLTPISPKYAEVETFTSRIGPSEITEMVSTNFIKSLFSWLGTILWVFRYADGIKFYDSEIAEIKRNYQYDYGRPQSFREQWADGRFYRYYQRVDQDMYFGILSEKLLNTIADSLEARGISVEKLREQSKSILNQGLIISGGNVNAENLAIGARAAIKNLLSGTQNGENANQSMIAKLNKKAQ